MPRPGYVDRCRAAGSHREFRNKLLQDRFDLSPLADIGVPFVFFFQGGLLTQGGRLETNCFSNCGQSPSEITATLITARRSCSSADISASRDDPLSASVTSRSNTISFFAMHRPLNSVDFSPAAQSPTRSLRHGAEKHMFRSPQARRIRRLFRRHKWHVHAQLALHPRCTPVCAGRPRRRR